MTNATKAIFKKRHGATKITPISEALGYYMIYCSKEVKEGTLKKTMADTGYEVRRYGNNETFGFYMCVVEVIE
jgi:hypothetical protein